jgi:hypothetical protein
MIFTRERIAVGVRRCIMVAMGHRSDAYCNHSGTQKSGRDTGIPVSRLERRRLRPYAASTDRMSALMTVPLLEEQLVLHGGLIDDSPGPHGPGRLWGSIGDDGRNLLEQSSPVKRGHPLCLAVHTSTDPEGNGTRSSSIAPVKPRKACNPWLMICRQQFARGANQWGVYPMEPVSAGPTVMTKSLESPANIGIDRYACKHLGLCQNETPCASQNSITNALAQVPDRNPGPR